jgi:hypothetical protein
VGEKPFRWNGYEIDRADMREVERLINTYPHKKAQLATLKARWAIPPDYHTYRSPAGSDGMPGAPGKVGDPTGNLVSAMDDYEEAVPYMRYLEEWLTGFEMVMTDRLDSIQRRLVTDYIMVPRHKREQTLQDMRKDTHASLAQVYNWLNMTLWEFANLLLKEDRVRKISGKTLEKNHGQSA